MNRAALRFVLASGIVAAAAVFLQAHSRTEEVPAHPPIESFPSRLGPWSGADIDISREVLDVLGPGDFLLRTYQDTQAPEPVMNLFIAYFPSQRAGDTIHSPRNCLPGAGWTFLDKKAVELSFPGHAPFPINRYLIAKGDARQIVLYWYWAHDRGVASEYWAKFYLVADAIRTNRTDGALVRIITPLLHGETADEAQSRVLPFAARVSPLLGDYIPR